MKLKNTTYDGLVNKITKKNCRILVYGAGVIGQIIVTYLLKEYKLYNYLDCFIDADKRKAGQSVTIDACQYEIRTPDYLDTVGKNNIILITNSKFFPVVSFLDRIPNLKEIEGYIIPMMQIYSMEHSESVTLCKQSELPLIPRKIHYCWFGGREKPVFLQKCMETWKEMCPDYEMIEWNESNYDVNRHDYTKEAFEKGKYGFVTDAARLDILYENGGIYLDTDVTLEKNLDILLFQKGFIGTEKWGNVNTGGGCGFVAKHPMLKKMIDHRERYHFVLEDGSLNMETCGMYETRIFLECGFKPDNTLQIVNDVTVYPSYINHPYDYMSCEMHKKEATVSVHHFYGGWMEEEDRLDRKNTQDKYQAVRRRMTEET
ncbi:MAG: hypothetical protein HFH24_11060 [Ruminococcus sp.]|nr:hypothetical protein [Ruminococcus sp.]